MSDEEEENFCYFGKPLDSYDEDAFPKKKPITVEEQIATDAQGRRRFHGAFTGGFSAGFFNTVGSLEGWTPSEFKSTRQDKAKNILQKPEDFMDQEDISEYGIAPQTVRATKDYSTSKKRRKQIFADGPIPGTPVLETLLTSGNETIGYLLLRKIGVKDKIKKRNEDLDTDTNKIYGCSVPEKYSIPEKIKNKQYKIPEIYTQNLLEPKSNTFGLDYKGLDRSHINLFSSSNLVVTDRNNKKFSIAGQAFGVGAFEEDDDDIYVKEDMSNYDFELTKEKSKKVSKQDKDILIFSMFKPSKSPLIIKKLYQPPIIPHSFSGKHKIKKSRFEPIEIKIEEEEPNRSQINPAIRARYLGEEENQNYTPSQPINNKDKTNKESETVKQTQNKSFDISSLMTEKFVSAGHKEDVSNILDKVEKSETLHGTKDMREAAKMKMFGALTRVSEDWTPCAVLCKRFNVPEPFSDRPDINQKKRTKNLIFENQKYTEADKELFKPGVSSINDDQPSPTIENTETNRASSSNLTDNIKTEHTSPKREDTTANENFETAPIDITEKIGVDEKIDLFKAVFLSSSESESEDEPEENTNTDKKTEEFKETILSDLVPKIRPLKQGILSNITFQPRNQSIKEIKDTEPSSSAEIPQIIPSYGPELPVQKLNLNNSIATIVLDDSDDGWIEKNSNKKEKKHKHKKHKKEKKKHKHSKKYKDD